MPARTYERGTKLNLALVGYFNTLSCNLSLIFKQSDKKNGFKNIVDPILGGAACQ